MQQHFISTAQSIKIWDCILWLQCKICLCKVLRLLWLVTSEWWVNWKKMNPYIHLRSDAQVGHFGKIGTVNSLLVVLEEKYKWKVIVIFSFWACESWVPRNLRALFESLDACAAQRKEQISNFNHVIWFYQAGDSGFVFEQAISDLSEHNEGASIFSRNWISVLGK